MMAYGNEQRAWTYNEYVKKYEMLETQRNTLLVVCEDLIHRAECMLQSHTCIEHIDKDCCDRQYMNESINDAEAAIALCKPKAESNQRP